MKNPNIFKIPVFLLLLAISACSTFNYKTYKEEPNKNIDDPEPNYDITLTSEFQDFTGFMFIGNRIENFSTYFNTFFNANENFNDAYDDYATRILANYNERQDSIFAKPRLSQESIDKFNIAIEKASKVIQYHKSSEYMDRSVLLIGKSYFFLGDYLKAERKFSEFISRLKSSRYLDEALLYLAKTQIRLENDKPALERLNELIKISKEKNVVSESYQSLAEYQLNKKDYENSIKNFKKAIEYSNDNEFKAQMQFLVASVIARSNPKLAAKEFDKVLDYNASYDLEYLARFNTAKNMISSGNFSEALDIIENLEVKYKDIPASLGQVNFLKGVYYDEKKDGKSSTAQYYDVIKNFPATVPSADASYKLAKYYELKDDYFNSFMYYRFSTEQSNTGTFYKEALNKTNIYKRYFELKSIINGENINTEYNEEFKKKTTKDYDRNKDPNNPNKDGDNGKSGGYKGYYYIDSILTTDDSVFTIIDTSGVREREISSAKFELAELFLYDLNRADSCEFYLKEAFDESKDYDFSAKVLFALSALYRKQEQYAKSDEILNSIISNYPLSPVANSSRKLLNLSVIDQSVEDSGDSIYSAAENKFINKEFRGALDDFKILINTFPASIHIERAYLGAGWICENVLNINDSAYYFYSMLIKDKPNSEAAAMVMQKVEEYETFNNVNKTDSSGANIKQEEHKDPLNQPPGELNNNNDPEKKSDGSENNNNIDPMQLLKELEEGNKEKSNEQDPSNNNQENPAPVDPGNQESPQKDP